MNLGKRDFLAIHLVVTDRNFVCYVRTDCDTNWSLGGQALKTSDKGTPIDTVHATAFNHICINLREVLVKKC